jgi:hypothetical protein
MRHIHALAPGLSGDDFAVQGLLNKENSHDVFFRKCINELTDYYETKADLCGISQGRGNLDLKLNLAQSMAAERDGYVVMLPIFVKGADPTYFYVLSDQINDEPTVEPKLRFEVVYSGDVGSTTYFKMILDYEGLKYDVIEDTKRTMVLSKGQVNPAGGCVVVPVSKDVPPDTCFKTPYALIDYIKERGLIRC